MGDSRLTLNGVTVLYVNVLHLIEVAAILKAQSETREGDRGREVGGEMDDHFGLHVGRHCLLNELELNAY